MRDCVERGKGGGTSMGKLVGNEAKLLSPAGQRTMQTVIDGYERLIAMMLELDKRKG